MAVLDWILTFDSPKAKELSVLICPMVYCAKFVMFPLIDAVVVDDVTFGD